VIRVIKLRKTMKWAFRGLLLLALVLGGVAIWKREGITRLLAVNSLFDEEKIVHNFSHMDGLFFSATLNVPETDVSPLSGTPLDMPAFEAWVEERAVTGLVVVKDGQIAHESYYLGTADTDLRISWSVAKSFLSALMGIVISEGDITSIDDPVTQYAPTLIGGAYDGTKHPQRAQYGFRCAVQRRLSRF